MWIPELLILLQEAGLLKEEAHFSHLYSGSCTFHYYPQIGLISFFYVREHRVRITADHASSFHLLYPAIPLKYYFLSNCASVFVFS